MTRSSRQRPAAFLDRDGVLNQATVRQGRPFPPSTVEEFVLLPGVVAACRELRQAGLILVVVTNQPDLARGTQDPQVVEAMHESLRKSIELDAVYICPHDDASHCGCRKPAPGMLIAASKDLSIDLARSFMVGDRWRDIEAGKRAGCRTIHIDRHYEEQLPQEADHVAVDLASAVPWIEACLALEEETSIAR